MVSRDRIPSRKMLLRLVHFLQKKMLPEGSMQAEENITVDERRKYLKLMRPRYQVADRKGQRMLLSEMDQVTGLHRKSLRRLLHTASLKKTKRRRLRQRS